jgi:hypothetical protein
LENLRTWNWSSRVRVEKFITLTPAEMISPVKTTGLIIFLI